jgi:hypothetical protein
VRLGYFRTNGDGASKQELRALEEAGCDKILVDSVVGHRSKTLASWLDDLATGDELVVLRLGHLMPMPGLLDLLTQLVARGIIVQSLLDDLRTSDPDCRLSPGSRSGLRRAFAHSRPAPRQAHIGYRSAGACGKSARIVAIPRASRCPICWCAFTTCRKTEGVFPVASP